MATLLSAQAGPTLLSSETAAAVATAAAGSRKSKIQRKAAMVGRKKPSSRKKLTAQYEAITNTPKLDDMIFQPRAREMGPTKSSA